MSAPLLGVPGKLKTLADRLTSARASNLDNLDAAVSTRAPASTALSSATWTAARAALLDSISTLTGRLTATRAANLDNLDAPISGIGTAVVKSVQRGSTSMIGINFTRNITISAVNASKSSVRVNFAQVRGNNVGAVAQLSSATLTSSTNLQFISFSSATNIEVAFAWEVVEFY